MYVCIYIYIYVYTHIHYMLQCNITCYKSYINMT